MLTKIEISGFKSFDQFTASLNPFLVVVGPNASGKSNLFDAIRLLSLLAGTDLRTAVKQIRGEPHELFRLGTDGVLGSRMKFAVEVLLDPRLKDPWGPSSRSSIREFDTKLRSSVRRMNGASSDWSYLAKKPAPS